MERSFIGRVGRTYADTDFHFEERDNLPPRHTNVVYIVLDDVGFASFGSYGNDVVHTPSIDALARDGLRYNNFHTTAICSATRACLLTGANHHEAGISSVVESESGLPNGRGSIDPAYATVAEILKPAGYATGAFGKWHLSNRMTPAGPFDGWPLQKGFDNYYGTLRAYGDQFHPVLTQDNTFVDQPKSSVEGYHFSEDIATHAIEYVSRQVNSYPDIPFFLYLAFGAAHAPFQAPEEYLKRYRGKFDEGWDVLRERWFKRQKEIGLIPEDATLAPRNEEVPSWESLSDAERKVFARQAEAFAGFLEHADAQIGRLVNYLRAVGVYENTLIVLISDNGASSEGGRYGKYDHLDMSDSQLRTIIGGAEPSSGVPEDFSMSLSHIDEIGSEWSQPHYPRGWANAFNTPFPWYKSWTFEGGIRDALIISHPRLISEKGGVRGQYVHVSDITPTVLDVLGVEKPSSVKGVPQRPFSGVSFSNSFDDAFAESMHRTQYYEVWGNRSIYKDGWVAAVNHVKARGDYTRDVWELYHVADDYAETVDLAKKYPEKLRELQDEFLIQAGRHGVFPLLSTGPHIRLDGLKLTVKDDTSSHPVARRFLAIVAPLQIPDDIGIDIDRSPFEVTSEICLGEGEGGTIISSGDRFGGFSLYVENSRLWYAYRDNVSVRKLESDYVLQKGPLTVGFVFSLDLGGSSASVHLKVNGDEVGSILLNKLYDCKGWGTTIGADPYTAVSDSYVSPNEFEGKINALTIKQYGRLHDSETATRAAHIE